MSDKPEKKISILASLEEDANKKSSILQELYLEFFGVFIPGFLLISGFCLLLFLLLFSVGKTSILAFVAHGGASSYALLLFLIASYAAGAILNRKSPDIPDEISAFRTWQEKKMKEKKAQKQNADPDDGVSDFDESTLNEDRLQHKIMMFLCPGWRIEYLRNSNSGKKFEDLCFTKYPYEHLRRYLIQRGLDHLLFFVPWCKCVKETKVFRSRAIVNELKNIIKFYGPKVFLSDLIHAESNIRMFTSLWHVCKYLLILSICGLLCLVCAFFLQLKSSSSYMADTRCCQYEYLDIQDRESVRNESIVYSGNTIDKNDQLISKLFFRTAMLIGLIILVFSAKKGVEKSIHYLRLKEIVMVLQQAYLLHKKFPNDAAWDPIRSRQNQFLELTKNCTKHSSCKKSLYSCECFK